MTLNKLDIITGMLYATGDEGIDSETLSEIIQLTPIQIDDLVKTFEHDILDIRKLGDKYFLMTNEKLNPYLQHLVTNSKHKKLTQASMESLAIIAYNQPITRHDVEIARGVNSDGPIKTLLEKGLIESVQQKDMRAHQLITTQEFLRTFGLKSLDDLPNDEHGTTETEEIEQFFKNLESEE
ncbi:SMC-Scp complex subunit ScpB [Macrococcus armenti]|uniref:SMC-Scp complex subunit ScpB n=1 Tax=Macrococcus armenti TaxID=2875764 RepID=UPI001CCAC5D1|nr:SMC-Scp complex subunit ScpB [Macrococcus armenti]UBH12240.1 SMC-Scp complex subunit ScpB [Macrococcus armenti]